MTEQPTKRGPGRPRKGDPTAVKPPRNSHEKVIQKVADATGFHKSVIKKVVYEVLEAMKDTLIEDGVLKINGLGSFSFIYWPAQTAYNNYHHKNIEYKEKYIPKCRLSPALSLRLKAKGPDCPAAVLARERHVQYIIKVQQRRTKQVTAYLNYREALLREFFAKNDDQSSSGSYGNVT